MVTKAQVNTAVVALVAFMAVAMIQRHVVAIPLVGDYLPS